MNAQQMLMDFLSLLARDGWVIQSVFNNRDESLIKSPSIEDALMEAKYCDAPRFTMEKAGETASFSVALARKDRVFWDVSPALKALVQAHSAPA